MFGIPLVGLSLVVNVGMRWPRFAPVIALGAVTALVAASPSMRPIAAPLPEAVDSLDVATLHPSVPPGVTAGNGPSQAADAALPQRPGPASAMSQPAGRPIPRKPSAPPAAAVVFPVGPLEDEAPLHSAPLDMAEPGSTKFGFGANAWNAGDDRPKDSN